MSTCKKQFPIPGSDGLTTSLPFSSNALEVVSMRYLAKDPNGIEVFENGKKYHKAIETPEGMFTRISTALANVELRYGKPEEDIRGFQAKFYDVMANFEFIPAGRTLTNAGIRDVINNCLVLHIKDDMNSIGQTLAQSLELQQLGVGLGFPWHTLRPAGFYCKSSQGTASGPCSFLHVYDTAFGVIKQQNRHGANMGVFKVTHPDILEFIHIKEKEGSISNFNVSMSLPDKFMGMVDGYSKDVWMCDWNGVKMKPRRVTRNEKWHVIDVKPVDMTAMDIMKEAVHGGWKTGEPGYIFIDTVNKHNTLPGLGPIESSNPCGEQFLHDGDVCNLGAINLEKFVDDLGQFNWKRLEEVTELAVRMLDNVIDISKYPVERVESTSKSNRRIGLGIMGFADALVKLRVGYNTEEGRKWAHDIMKFINDTAWKTSFALAKEKGTFANAHLSIWKDLDEKPRNAAVTNVAPTGTTSMIIDASSGIEPFFALAYYYKGILGGDRNLYYINKHLEKALRDEGVEDIDNVVKGIVETGSLQKVEGIPESIKKTFVTAMDISPESHVLMQAEFQKHCTNAISKTINFPQDATEDDILKAMILAWKSGCKGITVYRDKSREYQPINLNPEKGKEDQERDTKQENDKDRTRDKDACPACKAQLRRSEGCTSCTECDFSMCSR